MMDLHAEARRHAAEQFEEKMIEGLLMAVDKDTPRQGKVTADMLRQMAPAARMALAEFDERAEAIGMLIKAAAGLLTCATGWTGKRQRASKEYFGLLIMLAGELAMPLEGVTDRQDAIGPDDKENHAKLLALYDVIPDEWLQALFEISAVALGMRQAEREGGKAE